MNDVLHSVANSNFLWGHCISRGLADLGVRQVFFSPGSRSTPLVLGCEREERIDCLPVLDERTASFMAIGQAKRTGFPTVLICTSGSAPTHWYPAVTEAHYSGIPLILLSADRPSELQECGAGQTINQLNLFGKFVRSFHCLPTPNSSIEKIRELQDILISSYTDATSQTSGPVHINVPFREPLWPLKGSEPKLPNFEKITLPTSIADRKEITQTEKISQYAQTSSRPIIVAGLDCPDHILREFKNIPIFCDSLSPLRENEHPSRILRYENLLRSESFKNSNCPDQFLILGSLPTSKTLRAWIEQNNSTRIVIEPSGRRVDPLSGESKAFSISFKNIMGLKYPNVELGWLEKWQLGESKIENSFKQNFETISFDKEPKILRILSESLPPQSHLFIANSMPIRDAEWFWQPSDHKRFFYGARGVNGIDGTLGTAFGIAHGNASATFLLTGELAFLHDSHALLSAKNLNGSLTVFLINNDGGGIFENLSVRGLPEFEKCFATPQACNFSELCKAHDIEFRLCSSEECIKSWAEKPQEKGIRVLEIRTNRKIDREIRQQLLSIFP